jgi:hypothetical protein
MAKCRPQLAVLEGRSNAAAAPPRLSLRGGTPGAGRPEPLVASEIDVSDLDSFMLNVRKFMNSEMVALSSGEECKAAMMLYCHAWAQVPAASLPNDEKVLAHFSGAGVSWSKVRAVAMRGFVLCSDDRYYHPVLGAEANRAFRAKQAYQKRRAGERERIGKWRAKQNGNAVETCYETRSLQTVTADVAVDTIREREEVEPISNNSPSAAREVVKEVVNFSGSSLGRSAPSSEIKARKKELLQQKLLRYCYARFGLEEIAAAINGRCGDDPHHDRQWWFDTLDQRMRREGWDDRRRTENAENS